jgi:hypothetical protein
MTQTDTRASARLSEQPDAYSSFQELFPDYRPRDLRWTPVDGGALEGLGDALALEIPAGVTGMDQIPLELPAFDWPSRTEVREQWGLPDVENLADIHPEPDEPEDEPDGLLPPAGFQKNHRVVPFERHAWYTPFHMSPADWGIHLRQEGWYRVARDIYKTCPHRNTWPEARLSALAVLVFHQLFHYLAESAAVSMEAIAGDPYLYPRYYQDGYRPSFLTPWCFEEALANSYVYAWSESTGLDREWLRHYLRRQPPGYRSFHRYGDTRLWYGARRLGEQMLVTGLKRWPAADRPFVTHESQPLYPVENLFALATPPESYLGRLAVPIRVHRAPFPRFIRQSVTNTGGVSKIALKNLTAIASSIRRMYLEGGDGNFLIISLPEEENIFVQMAAPRGEPNLYVEAANNSAFTLAPERRLTETQIQRMYERGWRPPAAEPDHNFSTHWQAFNDEDRRQIAYDVLETFAEVYSVPPGQPLQVEVNLSNLA